MPVPQLSPGELYPQAAKPSIRDFPFTFDFLKDGTGRSVTQVPGGQWFRHSNPASGGQVGFQLAPQKSMREPGTQTGAVAQPFRG